MDTGEPVARVTGVEEPPPLPPATHDNSPTVPVDSWEAEAEDPILTPDQDEDEEIPEDEEETIKLPKKKPVKTEETKSKKEHVNVVFIGHVGMLIYKFCCQLSVLNAFVCLVFRCW